MLSAEGRRKIVGSGQWAGKKKGRELAVGSWQGRRERGKSEERGGGLLNL